jgi:CCR4-NOT complex subunit CAF16
MVKITAERLVLIAEYSHRAMNPVVRSDIVVADFLNSVGGYRYKDRRDHLLDLLDIDLDWHMHNISDGERRRVQLCMGLMAPWDVLLLDEVSTRTSSEYDRLRPF